MVENSDDEDDNCTSNNYDCAGICDGDAQVITYCEDADGDGFGNQEIETVYCDALVEEGWVEDCSDSDDICYSNYHDCAGVCNGSSQIQIYYFDSDGDGLGGSIEQQFCSDDEISELYTNLGHVTYKLGFYDKTVDYLNESINCVNADLIH